MKKFFSILLLFLVLLFLGASNIAAQNNNEKPEIDFIFGPRVGFSWVIVDTETFNAVVQNIFPDSEQTYRPFFTQFGLNLEQRIRLGDTKSHFALQEVLLFGGLDQNVIFPFFSFLMGFRSFTGLEFGIGPNISFSSLSGSFRISISVVYAVGWTFTFQNVYVPVNIAVVPTPRDNHPRLTFLTGFNFKVY